MDNILKYLWDPEMTSSEIIQTVHRLFGQCKGATEILNWVMGDLDIRLNHIPLHDAA
jgi:hypothetical protein